MEKSKCNSTVITSLEHLKAVGVKKVELLKKNNLKDLLREEIKNKLNTKEQIEASELTTLCGQALKEFHFLLKDYLSEQQSISEITPYKYSSSFSKDNFPENKLCEDAFYVIHSDSKDSHKVADK